MLGQRDMYAKNIQSIHALFNPMSEPSGVDTKSYQGLTRRTLFSFFPPKICAKQIERFPKKIILAILDDKLDPLEPGQCKTQVYHVERHRKR